MIRTDLIAPMAEMLRRRATEDPSKLAFEDLGGDRVSYDELDRQSAALAGHLQDRGLEEGERVAILLPNSVAWVVSCAAIARASAVTVPISHDATESEIEYRLSDAGCSAAIVSVQHADLVRRLQADLPELCLLVIDQVGGADGTHTLSQLRGLAAASRPRDPADLDTTAFIVYTSGTTGKAKGVMLSMRSMLWVGAACWAPIGRLSPEDTVLSTLPLFHSYALNLCVLSVIATGASEVLLDKYSTQEVLRQVSSGRFTVLPGVPTMFHYLLEASKSADVFTLPGIRRCFSAGAILPAALNRDFEERFGIALLDGYGITETSTMVTMNWPDAPRTMGSCGLPLPGVAVRMVDLQGQDVAQGEEGELLVRGPNVMQGYHGKPKETAKSLVNGWYHTGDLARADAYGFIAITGRLKEIIIRGGQNIAPAELEDTVLMHADVLDCAAVGLEHPHLGEVPVVCVVLREGKTLDGETLRAHCAERLSAYKVPSEVHFVASIPRTGSGKVIRFKLKESLSSAPSQAQPPQRSYER
jgi:long-chain acyl-CoA synthetase